MEEKPNSVVIHFRGSKADQFGKGTSRVLSRSKQRRCCPVLAAWFLVSHHKDLAAKPDSLLCKVDVRMNLQVKGVIRAIQRAAELARQNPQNLRWRDSLIQCRIRQLRRKTAWEMDAVERYTRISGQLTSRMTPVMLAKSAL
ncbi:Hypothetical protein PHPALM_19636 [Phytophthora palmivora]|uniref:Uncharacterized protein n=1 Tax=Phytophthora palmivora TaxID=4796 RepID=A0A2P4XGX7_9STRA|nr:Hypothetical protein PHPALM_19636 [Phytophthora palmivora]